MEPVFANTHIGNVEMIAEKHRKVWHPSRYPLGWFLIAFAVGIIGLAIGLQIFRWWISSLLLICYGIYNLNFHRIWAEAEIRDTKQKNNGQVPPATVTVTDMFTHQYRLTTFSIPFPDVEKVYFLEHSILVLGKDRAFMTFQRTGFTKGDPEELEKFILEHCPQAQIIHKT